MNLRHLRSQVRVEQRIFWRNRSAVFFTFVLPLALLPALALTGDPAGNIPVLASLVVLSNAFQGLAIQVAMHRDQGVLKTLMASPLAPSTFILAKCISVLLVVMLEIVIVALVGVVAFGAEAPASPVALFAAATVGTIAFVALGWALAGLVRTAESAPAVANAAYLGLILITVLLERVEAIPTLVGRGGDLLPLARMHAAIEQAWTGPAGAFEAGDLAVVAAWGLLAGVWATRRFRWEPADER